MSVVIEVEGLSKRYRLGTIGGTTLREDAARWWRRLRGEADLRPSGEIWALRDVGFTVGHGEVLGIIGANGSGKSTLLKILTRITAPTSGRVRMRGRVASMLEVGTGFHPELTGRENVFLNGAILGMTREEVARKFDEIVDFSGVETYVDTPVKRYSSGMKVRLAFAVAAHLEPEILLIDEVLAVGDAAFQKRCLGKIDLVAGEGRTVLFVSHDMMAVETLTERCLWLHDGSIRSDGTTQEVVERYISKTKTGNGAPTVDLTSTERRGQHDHQVLRRLDIFGGNQPTHTIRMGDPIRFELSYAAPLRLPSMRVGIGVNTVHGTRVVSFNSQYDSAETFDLEGDGHIVCDLGSLPLAPGRYEIVVFLQDSMGGTYEGFTPAGTFEVIPSNVYDVDFSPRVQKGHVFWKAEWSVGSAVPGM